MASESPIAFELELNPEQLAAVIHPKGPQLVLAGAGSGKTRVITHRIAWLIFELGVDPHQIVAVTFTNKAAGEMRERVERLLGLFPLPTFVGTFHRLALSLLRRYGERVGLRRDFIIFNADDQLSLVKKALAAEELSEKAYRPRSVLGAISSAKNQLLDPNAYEARAENFFERRIAPVYRRYQSMLAESSGLDFDDMLKLAVRLLDTDQEIRQRQRRRIRHLLVDEFQDTNHAQLQMVLQLVGEDGNITAVGDEDQAIYRWRGADLGNVLEFERSFPGAVVRKLERNYRSTQNILTAAGRLVSNNLHRRPKRLWTDAGDGEPIELYRARDEQDEARWVVSTLKGLLDRYPLREMAILVRTNAQTRALEEQLLRQQVPYVLVGGVRFYERAEIKDLLAYLRVLLHPRDNLSLLRILNQPPRGIGKGTRQLLLETASREGLPLWDVLLHDRLGGFGTRATRALTGFRDLIGELQAESRSLPLPDLLDRLLAATTYADLYRSEDAEDQARLENIDEFLSAAQDFTEASAAGGEHELLTSFLDHVSLVTELDEWNPEGGVSLMTLHSAKGLEFSAAVVAGLEDGLLPHFNAGVEPEAIEEERRLLYVGMTRARERLLLSTCRRRRVAGRYQDQLESPFLAELPEDNLRVTQSPTLFHDERSANVHRFFSSDKAADDDFDQASDGGLQRGRRVRHPSLGPGVIMELEGEGETMKLTVFFDRAGRRKLVAKYAKLEPL